jgi:hypothetical protein
VRFDSVEYRFDMCETIEGFKVALPKGFLPAEVHQALAREAVRRGVPFVALLREALLNKAEQITAASEQAAREEVAA